MTEQTLRSRSFEELGPYKKYGSSQTQDVRAVGFALSEKGTYVVGLLETHTFDELGRYEQYGSSHTHDVLQGRSALPEIQYPRIVRLCMRTRTFSAAGPCKEYVLRSERQSTYVAGK